jgi:hypothetical protein
MNPLNLLDNEIAKRDAGKIYLGILDSFITQKSTGKIYTNINPENIFSNNEGNYVLGNHDVTSDWDHEILSNLLSSFDVFFFGKINMPEAIEKLKIAHKVDFTYINSVQELKKITLFSCEQIQEIVKKLSFLYDRVYTNGEKYLNTIADYLCEHENLFTIEYIQREFKNFDYRIRYDNIDGHIEKCNSKFMKMMKEIFEKVMYFDFDSFFTYYNQNLDTIKEHSKTKEIIFFTTQDSVEKSNFWLTMYSILYLINNNVQLRFAYNVISDFIDVGNGDCKTNEFNITTLPEYSVVDNLLSHKEIIGVYCDDIPYSGNQLSGHLSGNCGGEAIRHSLANIPANVSIFLNVCGITKTARDNIEKLGARGHIIYPIMSENRGIKSFLDILIDLYGEDFYDKIIENDFYNIIYDESINRIYVKSLFYTLFSPRFYDRSVAYLFLKYPDAQSTMSNLCFLKTPVGFGLDLEKYPYKERFDSLEIYNYTIKNDSTLTQIDQTDKGVELFNEQQKQEISNILRTQQENPAYPWIVKCNNVENIIPLINTYDTAFSNFAQTVEKHKGMCEKIWKEYPKSFYKQIEYNVGNSNIDSFFREYAKEKMMSGGTINYKLKYEKYRAKNNALLSKIKKFN